MSEEHARLVVEAYSAGMQYGESPDYHSPAGRLLRRCLDVISRYDYAHWPYTLIPAEAALAMPPVVANVYLAHDMSCHCTSARTAVCTSPTSTSKPARSAAVTSAGTPSGRSTRKMQATGRDADPRCVPDIQLEGAVALVASTHDQSATRHATTEE